MQFSLLDFGLRDDSMNSLMILDDVLSYSQIADQLGYKRIWLTEHHISDTVAAWYNPLPILPLIAGTTRNIIVGIAGVQLTIHNAYHTAVNYKLLANLYPDRIDLGLAAGNPSGYISQLIPNEPLSVFEKQQEVIRLLRKEDELTREQEFIIPPYKGDLPNIWLLGSSYKRLPEVLELDVGFSRSLFHGTDKNFYKDELEAFKEKYIEKYKKNPKLTLTIAGCCHHTDKKARYIAENCRYHGLASLNVVGSMERFRDTIFKCQEEYGFDEFTFLNVARSPKDRQLALNLIRKMFD